MYYLDDKEFGRVYISLRSHMRNITMRWRGGNLSMNAPVGVTRQQLEQALNEFRPRLRLSKAGDSLAYHVGQMIQCYGFTITIAEQDREPHLILFGHNDNNITVSVPRGIDINSPHAKKWISKALKTVVHDRAPAVLLPLARSVSDRLGVAPSRYEIGRGLRKLGHCTRTDKVIQLSANLAFLPQELIELIICHELAHITHMNHSPQFHALVNTYVGGREKELEARLKVFAWPVMV